MPSRGVIASVRPVSIQPAEDVASLVAGVRVLVMCNHLCHRSPHACDHDDLDPRLSGMLLHGRAAGDDLPAARARWRIEAAPTIGIDMGRL